MPCVCVVCQVKDGSLVNDMSSSVTSLASRVSRSISLIVHVTVRRETFMETMRCRTVL